MECSFRSKTTDTLLTKLNVEWLIWYVSCDNFLLHTWNTHYVCFIHCSPVSFLAEQEVIYSMLEWKTIPGQRKLPLGPAASHHDCWVDSTALQRWDFLLAFGLAEAPQAVSCSHTKQNVFKNCQKYLSCPNTVIQSWIMIDKISVSVADKVLLCIVNYAFQKNSCISS